MDYKKYLLIPAPPEEVYLALTKEQSIQLWTGDEVQYMAEPETEFTYWGGDISGRNISFEPHKKIVQQWYFGDENPASIVTIKLHHDAKGTSLEFHQTNIPEGDYEEFTNGLNEHFLGGLLDFFEE